MAKTSISAFQPITKNHWVKGRPALVADIDIARDSAKGKLRITGALYKPSQIADKITEEFDPDYEELISFYPESSDLSVVEIGLYLRQGTHSTIHFRLSGRDFVYQKDDALMIDSSGTEMVKNLSRHNDQHCTLHVLGIPEQKVTRFQLNTIPSVTTLTGPLTPGNPGPRIKNNG